jgi:predicted metal-dependent hydrolase
LGLRGMFAAQQESARSRDQEREKRIVGRQRQAEQAPCHGVAADLRRRRVRTHDISMRYGTGAGPRQDSPLHACLIGTDQAGGRNQDNCNDREGARIFLPHKDANQTDYSRSDMRPALPVTHFTGREVRDILKAKRTQQKRQRASAHHSCNLFITNHDGKKSSSDGAIRGTNIADLRSLGKPHVLFKKKSTSPLRHELLKIDGRMLEVRVRLNPRARRMIVKVNPATGEISVTAPSRRGLPAALDFARGEKDWIVRQLAKAPGPVALTAGAIIPFRGDHHEIRAAAKGPAPVWRDDGVIWVRGHQAHAPRRVLDFLKSEARKMFEVRVLKHASRLGVRASRITVRDTASRWGSCSSGRSLSFSWRLIMAPDFVLDYVVAHEVAHLREMNHSSRFWAHVKSLIPDMDAPQDWLKANGRELQRYAASKD